MLRIYMANILLIAVCSAWIVPFVCILCYGEHVVTEPNSVILWGELLMLLLVLAFAIANVVGVIRKCIGGHDD